jgi:hypothetical protein
MTPYHKCVNRRTFEELLCSECPDNTGYNASCLTHMRKYNTWICDKDDNVIPQIGEYYSGKVRRDL